MYLLEFAYLGGEYGNTPNKYLTIILSFNTILFKFYKWWLK